MTMGAGGKTTPCVGNDPHCPCQDGDLCHYEGDDPMEVPHENQ